MAPQWAAALEQIEQQMQTVANREQLCEKYFTLIDREIEGVLPSSTFKQAISMFDHRLATAQQVDAVFEVMYGGHLEGEMDDLDFKDDVCYVLDILMLILHQLTQGVQDAVQDGAADELIKVAVEQSVPEDAVNVHDVKAAYKLLEADGARVIGHLVK